MAETIRISDSEFYSSVKSTAVIQTRSIGDQALHWMKIGKAIEESANFDYKHVQAALTGSLSVDDLSAEEQAVFMDDFDEALNSNLADDFAKHFENLKGVDNFHGMDDNGNIISEK